MTSYTSRRPWGFCTCFFGWSSPWSAPDLAHSFKGWHFRVRQLWMSISLLCSSSQRSTSFCTLLFLSPCSIKPHLTALQQEGYQHSQLFQADSCSMSRGYLVITPPSMVAPCLPSNYFGSLLCFLTLSMMFKVNV